MAAEYGASTANPIAEEVSPTSSPKPTPAVTVEEQRDEDAKRVENQEALQYWGSLVKPDKWGSDKLNRLLTGIAHYISNNFEGTKDCTDLTPTQLAAFYRAVGGNYDVFFADTDASSIAFIYKSLGCLHSIQPADETDGHAVPTIPALKPRGFVTWQTIQLLLCPEEHVPFLQSAVEQFDIVDPDSGEKFPKILPREAFPKEPNQEMLDWYDQVYEKLRQGIQSPQVARRSQALGDAFGSEQSGDEKIAANYYRNPMFKDPPRRPSIERSHSKTHNRSPRQVVADSGRAVMHSVRQFWNPTTTHHHPPPRHGRRSSLPDRYREEDEEEDEGEEGEDDNDYEDITPTSLHPQYRPKTSRRRNKSPEMVDTDSDSDRVHVIKRPTPPRRTSSSRSREYRDRDSRREREWVRDSHNAGSKHNSPPLRHRRSHEPAVSPRDYFPPHIFENEGPRRHSHASHYATSEPGPGGFTPSTEPLFASRIAKMENLRTSSPRRGDERGSYPRSVPIEERGSYNGRPTVRYSRRSVEPVDESRPRYERKKRSDEYLDEYDENSGYGRRSHSYERDMDRLRSHTRYVEGAHGRRYPSEAPWK